MKKVRRVAVLVETDDSWGRRVVASIATFAKENQWRLLIAPRDHQHRLRLPKRWQGDGVLVSMRDRSMAEHVRRSGLTQQFKQHYHRSPSMIRSQFRH